MKNKLEQKIDVEFEERGIKPYIYHISQNIRNCVYFTGITIVLDKKLTWSSLDLILDRAYICEELWEVYPITPATRLLTGLRKQGIYGVAICDRRDTFNMKEIAE